MKSYDLETYYPALREVIRLAELMDEEYDEELKENDTDGDGIVAFDLSDIDIDVLGFSGNYIYR